MQSGSFYIVTLDVFMLSAIIICHYDEFRCSECHYASTMILCHNAESHTEFPYAVWNYAVFHYAECHYAECHYAECHYAESHYAESHYAEFP